MTLAADIRPTVTIADIRELGTVRVPTAAAFIGVSPALYYAGVKEGTLPGLTLGRRVVVPVYRLLDLVGIPSALPMEASAA